MILCFESTTMQDFRRRRWHWWAQLSAIKIYVKACYAYTKFSRRPARQFPSCPNSLASGNVGQDVVKTPIGTVCWIPSDKRIVVATANHELKKRIAMALSPWSPEK